MKTLKTTIWRWIVLPIIFVLFIGCACQKYMLEPGLTETKDKTELLNFPRSYRLVHKVRLKVRGMSLDFTGYLAVNGACCRAVAVSEIGGTIFDLLNCNGLRKVIKNPARIPATSLKRGVLGELDYLFAHPEGNNKNTNDARLTVKINKDDTQITLLLLQDGCLLSEINIQSFQTVEGWPHPIPAKFQVNNKRWGYTMEVELLRLDMRPVDKNVFDVLEGK